MGGKPVEKESKTRKMYVTGYYPFVGLYSGEIAITSPIPEEGFTQVSANITSNISATVYGTGASGGTCNNLRAEIVNNRIQINMVPSTSYASVLSPANAGVVRIDTTIELTLSR
jgi:hypothetical protein